MKKSKLKKIIDSFDESNLVQLDEIAQKHDLNSEDLRLMVSIILHNDAEEWSDEQIFSMIRGEATNITTYQKAAEEVLEANNLGKVIDSEDDSLVSKDQQERVDKLFELFAQGKLIYKGEVISNEKDALALVGLALQKMKEQNSTKEVDSLIEKMENPEKEQPEDGLRDTWQDVANSVKEKISNLAVKKYKIRSVKEKKGEPLAYGKRVFKSFWKGISPMLNQIFGQISSLPEDLVNWLSKEYKKIKTKELDLIKEGNDALNKKSSNWTKYVMFNSKDTKPEEIKKGLVYVSWYKEKGYVLGYNKDCEAWVAIDPNKIPFKLYEGNLDDSQYLFQHKSNYFIKKGIDVEDEKTKDLYYLELPQEPKIINIKLPLQTFNWLQGPLSQNENVGQAVCFGNGDIYILDLAKATPLERNEVSFWSHLVYGDTTKDGNSTLQESQWEFSYEYANEAPAWIGTTLVKGKDPSDFKVGLKKNFDAEQCQIVCPLDFTGKSAVSKDAGLKVTLTWFDDSERIPDIDNWILVKGKQGQFYVDLSSKFYDNLRGNFKVSGSGRRTRVKQDNIAYWCLLPTLQGLTPKIKARGQSLEVIFHDFNKVPPPQTDDLVLILLSDDTWDIQHSEDVAIKKIQGKKWCYLNI